GDPHVGQYGDRRDPRLLTAHRLRRLHRAASGAGNAAFGNRVQRVFDGPFTGKVTVSEGSATRLAIRCFGWARAGRSVTRGHKVTCNPPAASPLACPLGFVTACRFLGGVTVTPRALVPIWRAAAPA